MISTKITQNSRFLRPVKELVAQKRFAFCAAPVYMEKSCSGEKGHPPTKPTLGEPTFPTFLYETYEPFT